MYDVLLVGAGITSATLASILKHTRKVCVVETRKHIGGNCHDYSSNGSFIHSYGPHIFHSPSQRIVKFLSKFTEWTEFNYSVTAEVDFQSSTYRVPFPYSKMAAAIFGRDLTPDEIIDTFFRGYSQKMWGQLWDDLPKSIKGRVPKDTNEKPDYFPKQFVAMPKFGYTRMIENMFDGVEVVLNAGDDVWRDIPAKQVVYMGRPDLIRIPGTKNVIGEEYGFLPHRTLKIDFALRDWDAPSPVLNYCSLNNPHTRMVNYGLLTGGNSRMTSLETPMAANRYDQTPYYPIPSESNIERYNNIIDGVNEYFPNLILAGRLGSYKYFDMYQAVGQAMALAATHWGYKCEIGQEDSAIS